MRKVDQDPFSNGTEFMRWEDRNCDRCVKSSHLRKQGDTKYEDEYTKIRCAIQRDIFTRMCSNEPIAVRTIEICASGVCQFRKDHYKKYERFKKEPKLFDE